MDINIKVENIKCGGCAHTVSSSLLKLPHVESVDVEIEDGLVKVSGDEELDREALVKKLTSLGYPEEGKGNTLTTATSYVSCMVGKITK
ncbi:MAG: heavy-metal-associated domain-containing protein [Saprospiraceae bacterium]|nr:heavy-metal-associated domain-containing protein [Saprospiraceae bacterium]MCB9311031.1 heavy-metal-associated domain-containing protein [Lewinellaceae bacterium]